MCVWNNNVSMQVLYIFLLYVLLKVKSTWKDLLKVEMTVAEMEVAMDEKRVDLKAVGKVVQMVLRKGKYKVDLMAAKMAALLVDAMVVMLDK